jgi:hypothetical protein
MKNKVARLALNGCFHGHFVANLLKPHKKYIIGAAPNLPVCEKYGVTPFRLHDNNWNVTSGIGRMVHTLFSLTYHCHSTSAHPKSRAALIFPSIFIVAGFCILWAFAYFLYRSVHLTSDGTESQGTVTNVEQRQETDRKGRSSTKYLSTIRFSIGGKQ